MNEFLTQLRTRFSAVASATAGFYRRNTTILIGAATIFCILLVVWARLGFTFEIGRFFAAPPVCDPETEVCEEHLECRSFSCQSVPGAGDDECASDTECQGQSCGEKGGDYCPAGSCNAGDQDLGATWDCRSSCCKTVEQPPAYTCDTGDSRFCYGGPGGCPTGTSERSGYTCPGSERCCRPDAAPTETPTPTPTPTPGETCPCGGGSWGENGVTVCKSGGNIDTSQRCTTLAPGSQASVTVTICNNSAETIYSKEALFFSETQTCGAHDQNPGHSSVSGSTSIDPGGVEQVTYSFNVDSCGSWQLDDTWGPGNFVFVIGQVINTGVSCATPTPTPTGTATPTPTTSATPTPTGSATPTPTVSTTPTPSASASPAVSPSLSPSASPTPPPDFACEPDTQSVRRNVYATVRAIGGTGVLSWTTPDAQRRDGTCADAAADTASCDVRYSRRGTYEVTVTDDPPVGEGPSRSAVCIVRVTGGGGGGGGGNPDLDIVKVVRNYPDGDEHKTVAAAPGSTVEFIMTVFNDGSATADNVVVRDTLPDRLTYVPGSTTVNGAPAADGLTAGGLSVGDIRADESVVIRFRATVAPAARFTSLTTILTNIVTAKGSNTNEVSDNANVEIQKIPTVTQVKTGPGETLLAAVLVAGVMTLLYVSYTRTSTYRRREVEHISEQRDPLDFRS